MFIQNLFTQDQKETLLKLSHLNIQVFQRFVMIEQKKMMILNLISFIKKKK
jgi:hypothetical protein